MGVLIGLIIGVIIASVISGLVIWVVSKLNLGLKVDSFGWAMLAGLIIGILTNIVMQLVPETGGLVGGVIHIVVAAVVIFFSGKMLKGLTVDGFAGALLAAVVIAVLFFAMNWLALTQATA